VQVAWLMLSVQSVQLVQLVPSVPQQLHRSS
jgi:hypothetical protein